MRVYLIRHGITDWNIEKRFQGREDIELNEIGLKQAEWCGKSLANLEIDAVVTSPLKRALVTAEKILKYHENAAFEIVPNLIERDFGIFSGRTREEREEMRELFPSVEPEPRRFVAIRVIDALKHLYEKYPDGKIVAVTHGGVIVSLMKYIRYEGLEDIYIDNVSVTEIEYSDGEIRVIALNMPADEVKKGRTNTNDV